MKITVVGTGYVGLVAGTCLAEMGHQVLGIDIDEQKIFRLLKGGVPFYEPGLQELVTKNVHDGRLRFSTDIREGVRFGDVVISAVGTPPDADHRADLKQVKQVARSFGENLNGYKVFVNKSTVPVGTAGACGEIIREELARRRRDGDPLLEADFDVVSNPEFLREGAAVKDFLNPERIVAGVPNARAKAMMGKLYRPLVRAGKPLICTDVKSAEIIKYAANCFLATKISFINDLASFCEKAGGDIREIARGIGMDSRIGHRFLHAGIGYGGSCLPKDVKALLLTGRDFNHDFQVIRAADAVNDRQKTSLLEKLERRMPSLKEKTIAVWGIAFKPRTDDIREAPALKMIERLLDMGAAVRAFDPVAMEVARGRLAHERLTYCGSAFEAASDADALMIMTEWDEFRAVDFNDLRSVMEGRLILDGRNIFDPPEAYEAGFIYEGVGRPKVAENPPANKVEVRICEAREAREAREVHEAREAREAREAHGVAEKAELDAFTHRVTPL